MIIAVDEHKARIRPRKGVDAFCPECSLPVVAKMGKIRIHHWAHKEPSNCTYGKGMTQWHYRWIQRHYEREDWIIEYRDGRRRYDCFSPSKNLVLEFQTKPDYDYVVSKTEYVLSRGFYIAWIFHMAATVGLGMNRFCFEATSARRLAFLDIIQELSDNPKISLLIDSLSGSSGGKSSKGLLLLQPIPKSQARYKDFYKVPYVKYGEER